MTLNYAALGKQTNNSGATEQMTEIKAGPDKNLLDIVSNKFEISRGRPLPLGATPKRNGINFAVFSQNATALSLILLKILWLQPFL